MTALTKWFAERPAPTIERLRRINQAATSSAHIILALSYGLQDPHIRAINKMIVTMLLARHKAQRLGNSELENRIEQKLQNLHDAINHTTGCDPTAAADKSTASSACKRATTYTRRHLVQTSTVL